MERLHNSKFQELQSELKNYSFKYNERVEDNIFDAVIYDESNQSIAIVEVRDLLGGINKKALGLRNNPKLKHKAFIVIYKGKFRVYDISKNSNQEKQLYQGELIEEVKQTIIGILKPKNKKEIEQLIYNNLRQLLFVFFTPSSSTNDYKIDKQNEFNTNYTFEKIKKSVVIDKEDKIVRSIFKSKSSYETLLLNVLIDDLDETNDKIQLYRYSTLDAIFSTIKFFSYRLNGIQGMNDQKEGLFLFEQLFDNNEKINNTINDIFISSCSTKYDNLTMWRLYGDNSKGASITLELTDDYKNKPFYIKKLFYRNFDRIKSKIQLLSAQINELGYTIDSKMFSLFPFFIKSSHYDVEAEVRILYDKSLNGDSTTTNCEWGISEPYKIIRPYVDIKIFKEESKEYNDILPFKIKEIVLGPNCPFSNRNIEQIKHYLHINGLDNINVKPSKIDKDTYIG